MIYCKHEVYLNKWYVNFGEECKGHWVFTAVYLNKWYVNTKIKAKVSGLSCEVYLNKWYVNKPVTSVCASVGISLSEQVICKFLNVSQPVHLPSSLSEQVICKSSFEIIRYCWVVWVYLNKWYVNSYWNASISTGNFQFIWTSDM